MKKHAAFVILALGLSVPVYAQASLLPVVQELRARYPTPMAEEQIGELVTMTAERGGPAWGVLLKNGGTRCPSRVGFISCDILVHIPTQQEYDILADAEGAAIPVWSKLPFKCGVPPSGCDMQRVRAVAGGVTPRPVPDPGTNVPNPGTVDLGPIQARLDALERDLAALRESLADESRDIRSVIEGESRDIRSIIAALPPQQPLPIYKGSLWGIRILSKPCPECSK